MSGEVRGRHTKEQRSDPAGQPACDDRTGNESYQQQTAGFAENLLEDDWRCRAPWVAGRDGSGTLKTANLRRSSLGGTPRAL